MIMAWGHAGHIRVVQRHRGSDDALQLLISQLVDHHDLRQLLAVPGLVLHEVRNANVLHLSHSLEPVHVFIRHLSPQTEDRHGEDPAQLLGQESFCEGPSAHGDGCVTSHWHDRV